MTTTIKTADLRKAVALRAGLGVPIIALIIILPAGNWAYWQGWMYVLTLIIPILFIFSYLLKNDPGLLERRMHYREKESAQKKIIGLSYIYLPFVFILPGLDVRFGWSNLHPWISILANACFFAGYMVFFWVLMTNSFVSRVIEVEKSQRVISTGPYAIVRHPMYVGVTTMYLASPLALGSFWTLFIAVLIIPLLAARIRNEEQVLLRDLPGYAEYSQKVKYRLVPWVW